MSLYKMIYGMNININLGIKKISLNWNPSRDGYSIEIQQVDISGHLLEIKFFIEYNHSENKEKILKKVFND